MSSSSSSSSTMATITTAATTASSTSSSLLSGPSITASTVTSTASLRSSETSTDTEDILPTGPGDPRLSGTSALPTATATATITASTQAIQCPGINRTVIEEPTTGNEYIILCGRDYTSVNLYGAVDIANFPSPTFLGCIEQCASTANCSAVGWGSYFGVDLCWLKSHIGEPIWSESWQVAVQVGQGQPANAGLDTGAKAGIAVGVVVGVLGLGALVGALWWTRRGRRRARKNDDERAAAAKAEHDRVKSPGGESDLKSGDVEGGDRSSRPLRTASSCAGTSTPGPGSPDYLPSPMGIGSGPQTPTPRGEKGAAEWDWRNTQQAPRIHSAEAELPGREDGRYGPEHEMSAQEASTRHRRGPPFGREAAEQKVLLQDIAFIKQQQRLNTVRAESSRAAAAAAGGTGSGSRATASSEPRQPPDEPPDGGGTKAKEAGAEENKEEGGKALDDKDSDLYELE